MSLDKNKPRNKKGGHNRPRRCQKELSHHGPKNCMLLSQSNNHRRQDLAIQQRIRRSHERTSEEERGGRRVHSGASGDRDDGYEAQEEDGPENREEFQSSPRRRAGENPDASGQREAGDERDSHEHGEPRHERESAPEPEGLAHAVPALEGAPELWRGSPLGPGPTYQDDPFSPRPDSEIEPDGPQNAAQLPEQISVTRVRVALCISNNARNAR